MPLPENVARNLAHSSVTTNEWAFRYGCISARIGATFAIKTTVPYRVSLSMTSARSGVLRPGQAVSLMVCDITTASPEALAVLKWVCKHPSCRGQRWDDKESLLADPEHSPVGLQKDQQTHVYFAVAEVAHVPGKPAVCDAAGNVVDEAVPPAGFIQLFADEV